jgi:hypothetical protein
MIGKLIGFIFIAIVVLFLFTNTSTSFEANLNHIDGRNLRDRHFGKRLTEEVLGGSPQNAVKQAFEFAIGFAERGSRRGYNPDIPNLNPFHIRYRSLETALNYQFPLNTIKESWDIPLDLHAGLRFGRILQIEDTEQYALYLEQVYRKMTVSLEFGARYPLNENWLLSARANYSAISMLNEGASNNPLYPTGVYNNAIGFGLIYQMND